MAGSLGVASQRAPERILLGVAVGVSLRPSILSLQVARKLVVLEGELERAEERAEVSEL